MLLKRKIILVIIHKITVIKITGVEIENGRTNVLLASKREEKFNLCEERNSLLRGSFVLKFNNARDLEIIYAANKRLHVLRFMCIIYVFMCIVLL